MYASQHGLLGGGLLVLTILCGAVVRAPAEIFTVNSTGDLPDADQGDGMCYDGTDTCGLDGVSPCCTLRAAIQQANDNGNAPLVDMIAFGIPGAGAHTIRPQDVGGVPDFPRSPPRSSLTDMRSREALRIPIPQGSGLTRRS